MSIWMFRSATPYWVSFYHHKIVAQLGYGWRTPYTEAVLKTVHEDYFALTRGQPQHFRWSGYGSNFGDARKTREVIEHFMYCKSSVWPGRETQDINFSAPLRYCQPQKVGETGSQQEDLTLGVITPNNLPNSCCPRWVWRSCMGRTNCGCCHEAHCPSEQKLVVSKFCWQEIPPYPPSNRSSKKLIYSILVGGFRESKLSDSFLPVVNHCKRWPIDLHLRMILKDPPSPLQCIIRGRSCMGESSSQSSSNEKTHCAHLRGRSSIACDSLDAMPVYICRAQWTISKVWPLTSVCHVPTTANTVGRPKSSCTAWRRARHWSPRSAFRSHNPSSATNCRSVSGEGGTLAWTRSPMTGRKLWCIHCGSHFTVPKRAAANGIHPKCASSVSRPGNRFLALVPKPCRMAGRINSGSISMAWYILSPGSTRMVTSPGRRLRVGRAPCS